MGKNSTVIYHDYPKRFKNLSRSQFGDLIVYALLYDETGEVPDIQDIEVRVAFGVVQYDIDKSRENYEKKCKQNKENIEKRYENLPTGTTEYDRIPSDTKPTDSDSDIDSDSEIDSDGAYALKRARVGNSKSQALANLDSTPSATCAGSEAPPDSEQNPKRSGSSAAPADRASPPTSKPEKDKIADFKAFWAEYPRKVAKQDAEKAWLKLKPDEALLAVMLKALEAQKKSEEWRRDKGQYIPYPATWLNGKRWNDETSVSLKSSDPYRDQYKFGRNK